MRKYGISISVLVLCICLGISFFTLIYSTSIHSDILFMKYLLDDILSGGKWSDWRLSPAPSYFPDMIVYALAYSATNLVPLQMVFTTVVQSLIITALSIWLVRSLNPAGAGLAQIIPLVLMLLCVIATSHYEEESRIGIFFGSNNIQVPTVISGLVVLSLVCSYFERAVGIKIVGMVVVGALGYASSAVFIMCVAAPFIVSMAFICFLTWRYMSAVVLRKAVVVLFAFVISQFLGWVLSYIVTCNSPLRGRIPHSIEGAKAAIGQLLEAVVYVFSPSAPWGFFVAIVFLFVFLYAIYRSLSFVFIAFNDLRGEARRAELSLQELTLGFFFLLSTSASIFGSVLSGGFIDKYGFRYFETFIVVSVVLSSHYLGQRFSQGKIFRAPMCLVVFSVIFTAISVYTLEHGRNKTFSELVRNGAYNGQAQAVANCLDSLMESGIALNAGVADYWMARGVMYYMKSTAYISQSTDSFAPFFWISSMGPLKAPERYGVSKYNFIIADDGKYGRLMGFDTASLAKVAPIGFESLSCVGTDASILYYADNQLDLRVKEAGKKFLFSEVGQGSISFAGGELPGIIGSVVGNSKGAAEGDGQGVLSFGPYISLPKGSYIASLEFDSTIQGATPVGRVEIGRFDSDEKTVLYAGDIPSDLKQMDMNFTVPRNGLDKLEVHVIFNGHGHLIIHKLRFVGEQ